MLLLLKMAKNEEGQVRERELGAEFWKVLLEFIVTHPSGEARQTTGYMSLSSRGETRAKDAYRGH